MRQFDEIYRDRFERLSTSNLSDALDALGYKGATFGIRPLKESWKKILGQAVTLKMTPSGLTRPKTHLGVNAIEAAVKGNVIIIDNGGSLDTSCWGGILANGAKLKGISGVFIDGACRDLDDCIDIDFPVFARGTVVATARGRVMEESTNEMIQFGGVPVRPGDIVIGDRSGVVIVPQENIDEVLAKAEELFAKEERMIAELRNGASLREVDAKYSYEQMLAK